MITYNDLEAIIDLYLTNNNIKPLGLDRYCYRIYIQKEYLQNITRYKAELKHHGKDSKTLLFSDSFQEEIFCLLHLIWVIKGKEWADAQVFDKWEIEAICLNSPPI